MKKTLLSFTSRVGVLHCIALLTMAMFTFGLTACGDDNEDDEASSLGVSVSPKSLSFGAEGGTKSTYINYGSFSYYGASVRSEGHGWVSVATPGGPNAEIQVTVEPNTTGQERECYIDCYVMPNEDSSDSEKIKMPVHIQQSANAGGGNDDDDDDDGDATIKSVTIKYFCFEASVNTKPTWSYNGSDHTQDNLVQGSMFTSEVGYDEDPNSLRWEATLNGTTLHIFAQQSYANDYSGQYKYTSSLSLDITGFTGDFKKTRLENVVYLFRNDYSASEGQERELRLTNVPCEYIYNPNSLINAYQLRLSGTRGGGVDFSTVYLKNWWEFDGGTPVTAKYQILNDNSDKASFDLQFLPSTSSSAPRRTPGSVTIPIQDITPAASKTTHVEAAVR